MINSAREQQWEAWLRAAIDGDSQSYQKFLAAVAPHVRSVSVRVLSSVGANAADAEDIVQEVLLAIHLKRNTWDTSRPLKPWLSAIVRNKAIDALRRRGRHVAVPLDEVMETLACQQAGLDPLGKLDVDTAVRQLNGNQKKIVNWISIEGASVRDAAKKLQMSEGAVRVALHRALKTLSKIYREESGGAE